MARGKCSRKFSPPYSPIPYARLLRVPPGIRVADTHEGPVLCSTCRWPTPSVGR
uniref:Uncharacterized protein n=1 Tax=Hyaloperonospora arabidopsidis (strain Emoy2) TaxID=559515 RepID=M4BMQ1_HYAAE